jgi:SAM-dependent methyltransferase
MDGELHHALDRLQDRSFWFRARNRLIKDLIARYFANARNVLEVGCGTGYVLHALRSALPDARLSGSEIYSNGLDYARRRVGGDVELFQMDARTIPFSSEFDLICAFDVLEHVDEDQQVLSEMRRALKPGGGVLLSVPQHPVLWSQFDEIGFHKRRYRRSELAEKCRRAGFVIACNTSFVSTLLPAMLLQRVTAGRRTNYAPTEEFSLAPWLDRVLEGVLDTERLAIRAGLSFPVGGSRFVAAFLQSD